MTRPDKRSSAGVREISIQFEGLHGADGSARFGFGETKALASVSGPIEVRLAQEQASKATFEVNVRPLAGIAGTESKSLSSALRIALTPSLLLSHNPRTLIQLVVQSLTPSYSSLNSYSTSTTLGTSSTPITPRLRINPSLTASLINASTLALLNAGSFPMRGVVCAVGTGRVQSSSELVVDPSSDELVLLDGGGTFAFLIAYDSSRSSQNSSHLLSEELVWSNWTAYPFDESELVRAQDVARKAVKEVWRCMKEAVGDPEGRASRRAAKDETEKVKDVDVDDDEMEI